MLIAIDIDGTLLSSTKELSKDNISAIKNIQEKGAIICLATGRWLDNVKEIGRKLDLHKHNGYAIICNGSLLYSFKEDKILSETYHSNKTIDSIVEDSINNQFQLLMPVGQTLYITNHIFKNEVERYKGIFGFNEKLVRNGNEIKGRVPKITFLLEKNNFEKNKQYLNDKYAPLVNMFWTYENTCELAPIGIDKGQKLEWLINQLNIKAKDLHVIGDNTNDFTMFDLTQNSYCPANAKDSVKRKVNKISHLTNNESAVADIINNL